MMSGTKIYEFSVKAGRKYSTLTFRDSYLIMPVKLSALKKTFNLSCENKLYFPFLYNKKENYNIKLNKLPPIETYCPDSMTTENRINLIKWYYSHENEPFCLLDKLKEYCTSIEK